MNLKQIIVTLVLAGLQSLVAVEIPPAMKLEALPLKAPEPVDNPGTAAKTELGRLLFFDPVLSATRTLACATCHHPQYGWADGRSAPIGVGGEGLGPGRVLRKSSDLPVLERNVPSIINAAFNGLVSGSKLDAQTSPMFWDSRVSGLEAQALIPLRSREEMRGDVCAESEAVAQAVKRLQGIGEYRDLFAKAFGQPAETAVTAEHLAKAVASFERSLTTTSSAFDRFFRGDTGAIDVLQKRGLEVFSTAGCIQCHGGPMFSDFKLHFIGVTDASPGGRREFRTPTLRNLRHTAPYMHNGSLRALDDVLVFYEQLGDAAAETLDGGDATGQPPLDPLFKKLNLNPEDFPALTAFLDALNDDHYDREVPASVPSRLPVAGVERKTDPAKP